MCYIIVSQDSSGLKLQEQLTLLELLPLTLVGGRIVLLIAIALS